VPFRRDCCQDFAPVALIDPAAKTAFNVKLRVADFVSLAASSITAA
jgi:hypothetical protein